MSRTTTGTVVEAGEFGGAPAAFARDQLVVAMRRWRTTRGWMMPLARMDCASSARRSSWKNAAGLERVGLDGVDRDGAAKTREARPARGVRARAAALGTGGQERTQALTERFARIVGFVHGRESLWRV